MNLKELIFGEGVHTGGSGGVYRDSVQAWLPIKNIIGGVVITKDNRFVKIMEVLPVNIYLKSAIDRQNIISSFASYLQIAPDELQMIARTLPADTQAYVEQMQRYVVLSTKVQGGMSGSSTLVTLRAPDGKQIPAFARGARPELSAGSILSNVKLTVRQQDTVAFYVLESYEIVPQEDRAA